MLLQHLVAPVAIRRRLRLFTRAQPYLTALFGGYFQAPKRHAIHLLMFAIAERNLFA